MSARLIIDGNDVYEIDEDCLEYKKMREEKRESEQYRRNREKNHKEFEEK